MQLTKDEILAEAFKQLPDAQTCHSEIFTVIINNKSGVEPAPLNKNDLNTGNFDADVPLYITFRKHLYYPEQGLSCKTTWEIE